MLKVFGFIFENDFLNGWGIRIDAITFVPLKSFQTIYLPEGAV